VVPEMLQQAIQYGSAWGGCVVAMGAVHGLLAVLQVPLARRYDLRPLLWSMVGVTVLVGVEVWLLESLSTHEAMVMASTEMKQVVLSHSVWLPIYDRLVVLAVLAGQVLTTAVVHPIQPMMARRRR